MPRTPQNPLKVAPRVVGKLKIRDEVPYGNKERLAGICISEMQQLFLCFKKFGFNEVACNNELVNFKKCYAHHEARYNDKRKSQDSGKKSEKVMTKLLRRFPDRP